MSYYAKGEWNAICDVCGKKVKSHHLKKRWDGLLVCREDWEPRHPQEFVRAKADKQVPSWTRPEPSDTFTSVVATYFCTPLGSTCITNDAIAGCAIPNKFN